MHCPRRDRMNGNAASGPGRQGIEGSHRGVEGRRVESRLETASVQLLGRLVSREHETLVLGGILLPELGSLAVERTRTTQTTLALFPQSLTPRTLPL